MKCVPYDSSHIIDGDLGYPQGEYEGKPKETQAEVIEGKLKRCLKIVHEDDDEVAIEAIPISSKSPTIVDYKIYREGKKSYFKIIKADGNSQNFLTFGTMFKNFNKEDLEVLRSIVKERFKKTKPVDNMDNLLFQTLKTMFKPHVEDIIWKYQQGAVKRYRGTFELILDTNSEGDELGDEEDKDDEVDESSDSDSESEDAEDVGPTIEDEDPAAGDEGQQRAALVVETAVGEPLGLGYGALRRQEIALRKGVVSKTWIYYLRF
nr:hypothetical protein [Tanacetum cinerariifolium]